MGSAPKRLKKKIGIQKRSINEYITVSWSSLLLEKQMVFRANLLIRVLSVRCFLSIGCVLLFPVTNLSDENFAVGKIVVSIDFHYIEWRKKF